MLLMGLCLIILAPTDAFRDISDDLQPIYPIDNCASHTGSCRSGTNLTHCPLVCNDTVCNIIAAIILPESTEYLVNLQQAIEELNKTSKTVIDIGILPNHAQIEFILFNDKCDVGHTTISVADAHYQYCAHVFFGPVCDYCVAGAGRLAKYMGEYGTPVVTPGGFVFDMTSKKTNCSDEMFMLVNAGPADFMSFAEFFYNLIIEYEWKQVALMYEKDDMFEVSGERSCQLLLASVMQMIKRLDAFDRDDGDIQLLKITYIEYLKTRVGVKYGIIALCASQANVRKIMLEAESLGMTTSGEYVFFNFDLYNNASRPTQPWWDPNDLENNERARTAYRSLYTFMPAVEAAKLEQNETTGGRIYVDALSDGLLLYSHAVNKVRQLEPNYVKGTEVFAKMLGMNFAGVKSDENITINCNGQRVSQYALLQMNESYQYHAVAEYNILDKKIRTIREIKWLSGNAPSDTPACGYDNSKCPSEINILLIIIPVFCGIIIIIIGIFVYRHWKLERDISMMTWKINIKDITKYEHRRFILNKKDRISSSNLSLKKGSEPSLNSENVDTSSLAGERQLFTTVVYYKERPAAIKYLTQHPKLKIDLNRAQLRELKVMKDLSSDNLTKFYGANVERPDGFILTEYCSRGSLQDVLENEGIQLDMWFKKSLIQDLVKGMHYLHNSEIKSHGSLRSSNCVIDSKFNLKVTDFGMWFLRSFAVEQSSYEYDTSSHAYWERQLWTAPELLRALKRPASGTQKGDVYSFAIILAEIYTRQGVFYLGPHSRMNKQEIVESLKKHPEFEDPLRPYIIDCDSEMTSMMEKCWAENAAERPDFNHLKNSLRKINRSHENDGNILDNLLTRMEQYANNLEDLVDERTADYLEQKRRCEELVYQLLPKSVALQLINGHEVNAESFDSVTICFSDIVGFTTLAAESTPMQVIELLNDLYTIFDARVATFDVYKVETIGDAYMVVSGLPNRKEYNLHALEIARLTMHMLADVRNFKMKHRPDEPLRLRIGIHTGPCVAGIVGRTMPRYCLFGDTVNTASRMESTGEALKIHVSQTTKSVLDTCGNFLFDARDMINVKGKGMMQTYWLLGEIEEPCEKIDQTNSSRIVPTTVTITEPTDEYEDASAPLLS